ncbi:hypothetical protein C0991_009312 [Blastosporella zonata]|nr:hypothetical protein C0991_009312 [Blastosporella zonata]
MRVKSEVLKEEPNDNNLKKRSAPLSNKAEMGIAPKKARNKVSPTVEKGHSTPPIVLKNSLAKAFSGPAQIAKLISPPSVSPPSLPPPTPVTSTNTTVTDTIKNPITPTSTTTTSSSVSTSLVPLDPSLSPLILTSDISSSSSTGISTTTPIVELPSIVNVVDSTVRKARKAKVGQAMNAKSICKREWVKQNPNGTNLDFAAYWTALGLQGQKEFNLKAGEAKLQVTKAKGKKQEII